ncbi:hypothetical protein [Bradyrhizobium sp. BR13661]|uniref:hypothetical protein n=1 Tax=Bradyrhizobium sp. BR13661 TaxID=2940622 RepID=UPI0024733323|nr:hypothetical protein [Bradyrhizobium sp. BR13661]MDH6264081.1 hypothetical protein [Bradyrhizobium sp. BR13661]
MTVCLIKHEAVPDRGSFEVRLTDEAPQLLLLFRRSSIAPAAARASAARASAQFGDYVRVNYARLDRGLAQRKKPSA